MSTCKVGLHVFLMLTSHILCRYLPSSPLLPLLPVLPVLHPPCSHFPLPFLLQSGLPLTCVVVVSEGLALTSISQGRSVSSTMMSYPYSSKQWRSLIMVFCTDTAGGEN